jgi:dUTP pyrophosphatase
MHDGFDDRTDKTWNVFVGDETTPRGTVTATTAFAARQAGRLSVPLEDQGRITVMLKGSRVIGSPPCGVASGAQPVVLYSGDVRTPANDDAGFDLVAAKTVRLQRGRLVSVPTGARILAPMDLWYQIMPRSSLTQRGIICPTNTIDAGYTGELAVNMLWLGPESRLDIEAGQRIAQVVFFWRVRPEVRLTDSFPKTARGEAGFGSTGVR